MPSQNFENGDIEKYRSSSVIILDFWADWSAPCSQLNTIFDQLADTFPNMKFLKVEAEKFSDITEKYEVSSVPSFVFLRGGKILDRVEGANPPELVNKIKSHSSLKPLETKQETKQESNKGADLNTRLKKLINTAPVMLFMKGQPQAPQCGFSRKIVDILNEQKIVFSTFDILKDEEVRSGLKVYSNWPTFPQLYIDGNLIGGLDIVKEMAEEGELKELVKSHTATTATSAPEETKKDDLNTRIKKLLDSSKVMLFMKGTPQNPQCGFSQKIVNILNENKVEFNSFNILADEEIRSGLKVYSNWPTFPQLYSKGTLIGGLDIVKELHEDGELLSSLN